MFPPMYNDIEWILYPPVGNNTLYLGGTPIISFPGGGLYTLKMRYYGVCGYSPYASEQISLPGPIITDPRLLSRAYPNPVSDLLNIEIDKNEIEKLTESGLVKGKIKVDIRLYTHLGILVRNISSFGEKVQLNVSNLPNGVYFLHILCGPDEKSEVITIVIRR
jgi:hypothetical protein